MSIEEIFESPKFWGCGILGLLGVVVLFLSFEIISPGHRGVVKRFGSVQMQPMGEGLNLKIPFVDTVEEWDVKVQKHTIKADASSKDLQMVHTVIAVNFRINPAYPPLVRQKVGEEYIANVLEPAIQESVKAITAQYKAEDLLAKRSAVREGMAKTLQLKLDKVLSGKGPEGNSSSIFIIQAFNIEDFKFDKAFNDAIEQKQVAEQEAKRVRNQVEQEKAEADKKIEQARGRAESKKLEAKGTAQAIETEAKARAEAIRIESAALKSNPNILRLRFIERWDGKMPRVISSDSQLLLPLGK